MHNRTLGVWFGMVLGASLLGCPPAAKSAKDAPAAAEGSASDGEQQGQAKDPKQAKPDPAPVPSGGW